MATGVGSGKICMTAFNSPSPKTSYSSRRSSAAVVAPSSATSRDYHKMSRHTRLSTATSTCLLADHPTTSGNADPESDGSTRSGRTTGFPRWTCGDMRLLVATEEQRYGPRWLRDDDDDDSWAHMPTWAHIPTCQCQMWIYIVHSRKKTSNALNTLVLRK